MPSMDNANASRRFRSLPTSHPPPPQASSDPSTPNNRSASSGPDSGSLGELGSGRQLPRRQQAQHGQGDAGANELAQNPASNDLGRVDNAYATIRAGNRRYGLTGYDVTTHGPQIGQEGGGGQVQHALADYGAPGLSLPPSTASSQASTTFFPYLVM